MQEEQTDSEGVETGGKATRGTPRAEMARRRQRMSTEREQRQEAGIGSGWWRCC